MADKNEVEIRSSTPHLKITKIAYVPNTMSAPEGTDRPEITQEPDKWIITLKCDRKGSTTHAEFFNSRCGGYYHEYTGNGWGFHDVPEKLNFCFAVEIGFTYEDGGATRAATSHVVYLAQGHTLGVVPRNNWWIGGEQTVANGNGAPLLLAQSAANTVAMTINAGNSDFLVAFKYTTKDVPLAAWMGRIGDATSLARITVPGTHDSCARFGGAWTETQKRILNEQFEDGIRFVDIRCRHIGDRFAIHHGSTFQNLDFQEVLDMCLAFLNKNRGETILMSIKEEYKPQDFTRTFEETFLWYLETNNCFDRWYLGDAMPNLGAVRGKIVLFRRFENVAGPKVLGLEALPWPESATFTISNSVTMRIQDEWKKYTGLGIPGKWSDVRELLNDASATINDILYVNFCSAWSILTPKNCADYINPQLTEYFVRYTSGRFGCVVMDFETSDINRLMIATNPLS